MQNSAKLASVNSMSDEARGDEGLSPKDREMAGLDKPSGPETFETVEDGYNLEKKADKAKADRFRFARQAGREREALDTTFRPDDDNVVAGAEAILAEASKDPILLKAAGNVRRASKGEPLEPLVSNENKKGKKPNESKAKANKIKKKLREIAKNPLRRRENAEKERRPLSLNFPLTERQTAEAIPKIGTTPKEITESIKKNPEAGFSSLVGIINARIQDTRNILNGLSHFDVATRAKLDDMETMLYLAKEAAEITAAGESLYPDFDPEEPYDDDRDSALKDYLDGEIARQKKWGKDLPKDQLEVSKMFAAYFSTLRKQFSEKMKSQKSDLH